MLPLSRSVPKAFEHVAIALSPMLWKAGGPADIFPARRSSCRQVGPPSTPSFSQSRQCVIEDFPKQKNGSLDGVRR